MEQRQAICPAGKANTQCSRLEEKHTGKVSYRFEWSTHCENCWLRAQCVSPKHQHRSIVVGEHHTALQTRRREQVTPEFKQRIKHRNVIEGTQSIQPNPIYGLAPPTFPFVFNDGDIAANVMAIKEIPTRQRLSFQELPLFLPLNH